MAGERGPWGWRPGAQPSAGTGRKLLLLRFLLSLASTVAREGRRRRLSPGPPPAMTWRFSHLRLLQRCLDGPPQPQELPVTQPLHQARRRTERW